jgi:hypothetical protein
LLKNQIRHASVAWTAHAFPSATLFRGHVFKRRCIGSCSFGTFLAFRHAAWTTWTGARGATTGLALRLSGGTFFFQGDLGRNTFDDWLRTSAIDNRVLIENRRRSGLNGSTSWFTRLSLLSRLSSLSLFTRLARLSTLTRFSSLTRLSAFARLSLLTRLLVTLFALLARLRLRSAHLRLAAAVIVKIAAVRIVLLTLIVVVAIIALVAFLHLGLSRSNDTIVMFGVLQIVFSHDAVASALGIASQCRVFFGYMLSRTTNFYIWA